MSSEMRELLKKYETRLANFERLYGYNEQAGADARWNRAHMLQCRDIVDDLRALLARTEAGADECTLGVGDGSGKLFVHGSYDAIKACQALILRNSEPAEDVVVDEDVARGQFEYWAAPQGFRLHRRDMKGSSRLGQYCNDETQLAFEAFRAAYTRPQDASGDAERICDYLCEQEYDIGGRDELLAHIRAAMQAKEAK